MEQIGVEPKAPPPICFEPEQQKPRSGLGPQKHKIQTPPPKKKKK